MKIVIVAALALVSAVWAAGNITSYDEIYKTDETVVRGTIIERELGKLLIVETINGSVSINEADIKIIREDVPLVYNEKSPALALLLSILLPGLGQHYNGDYAVGGGQEVMCFGGAILLASALGMPGDRHDEPGFKIQVVGGVSFIVGGYLWSLIDAPLGASRATKRNMEKAYNEALAE